MWIGAPTKIVTPPHNCSTSDPVGFVSHFDWLEVLAHSDFQ
jgi:hypothetical protein